ncbi:MAG: DNA polymerase III subunit beta [Bacteroidetes bacterium]|nr:DNA polymerase III subunit beta [Bacteroidota bacterium]
MKFTIESNELQKVLIKISGVVPSKSTLPILENILFTLNENKLTLVATDMEISMSASLDVRGSENGSIAVPAKRVMDTLRALPDAQIVFNADTGNNKIKMITENGEYNLIGESSQDYPAIPEFKSSNELLIESSVIESIISKTVFSVSTDELRPAMTGLLLQFKEKEMRAVATDGHRLVRIIYTNLPQIKDQKDIIIPSKALNLISKAIESGSNTVSFSSTHIKFSFKNLTLTSRLIEESYPNYESVIPLENDKKLLADRNILLSAVKRVSLYSSNTTHQIRFSMKKDDLKIMAEDIDFGGEAKEKIACSYSAENIEIGFNAIYLIDILSHIDSQEVIFNFSSSVKAAIIKPVTMKENEDVLMLVMPMRLNV